MPDIIRLFQEFLSVLELGNAAQDPDDTLEQAGQMQESVAVIQAHAGFTVQVVFADGLEYVALVLGQPDQVFRV